MRRTGRTTRMVQDALHLSREGRAVYVIAANQQEQARIQQDIDARAKAEGRERHGIKVETWGSVGPLDDTFRVPGMHPNCIVLVDHFALESRYAHVLDMLHHYD